VSNTPQTLIDLGSWWVAHGGVNLGSVGNQKHCYGYHLGRDRIFSNCACRPDGSCVPGGGAKDYSVQTARDKAGLSSAASAIDLGRLGGNLTNLQAFSDWLAKRCLAGHPTTSDVREVIYSPDGQRVFGFKDGVGSLIPGYGDDTHLTHTHISFYRDSESRDKRPLFADYFTGAIGGDMSLAKITDRTPKRITTAAHSKWWDIDGTTVVDPDHAALAERDSPFGIGSGTTLKRAIFSGDGIVMVKPATMTDPKATDDVTPFTQADVDAAASTARDAGFIAGRASGTETERGRIVNKLTKFVSET
jgi:hypothetical protein